MKKFVKIPLQFFADGGDPEPAPDPAPTPTPEPDPTPTLAEITAEYDRKVAELEQKLNKANADLKASTDALNRIIDNRNGATSADATTERIKKLLR